MLGRPPSEALAGSDATPVSRRLGVLLPGMGSVATTFIAGVSLVKRGLGSPVGSVTQMGRLPGPDGKQTAIGEILPFAPLSGLVFGGWDVRSHSAFEAAQRARVLSAEHLAQVREDLIPIEPMRAAFFGDHVRRLSGGHVKRAESRAELVEELRADIRGFLRENKLSAAVGIWCGSTEKRTVLTSAHQSIAAFDAALERDDPSIMSSQLYGWALLKEGLPVADGSPNRMLDFPAAIDLSREVGVPIAGKDFKTGQTLLKTIIAPGLRARLLGVDGWFSTNILGNHDGEILADSGSLLAKQDTKLGVLEGLLDPESHPELYSRLYHKVSIEFYPPRGDAKESWDAIDLRGWLDYPMQLKVNFLCRDSILAAPLVLDVALFLDLAHRAGLSGPQEWLGFYFKRPAAERRCEHDLFSQWRALEAQLRLLARITIVDG